MKSSTLTLHETITQKEWNAMNKRVYPYFGRHSRIIPDHHREYSTFYYLVAASENFTRAEQHRAFEHEGFTFERTISHPMDKKVLLDIFVKRIKNRVRLS